MQLAMIDGEGNTVHLITRCERMSHEIENESGSEKPMVSLPFTETMLFQLSVLIQVFGLASLALARLSDYRSSYYGFRRLFLAILMVVGSCTMLAVGLGSEFWFSFAVTFSIMFIGATVDFRPLNRVRSI